MTTSSDPHSGEAADARRGRDGSFEDVPGAGTPSAPMASPGDGESCRPEQIRDHEHVTEDAGSEPQRADSPLYRKVMNFNRFMDETAKGLDPISAMIWMMIFRFENGSLAWASQQTIATRLGVSVKTVCRHIAILKKKRLLRVVERGRRGGRSNTYQLGILRLDPVAKRPERIGGTHRQAAEAEGKDAVDEESANPDAEHGEPSS
jgi:hypothetical protein